MGSSKITEEQVRHVAKLARLTPDDGEVRELTATLDAILEHVAQLSEVSTDGVEPTRHPGGLPLSFREDEVLPSLDSETALAAAPRSREGGFSVPKVLEEEG